MKLSEFEIFTECEEELNSVRKQKGTSLVAAALPGMQFSVWYLLRLYIDLTITSLL